MEKKKNIISLTGTNRYAIDMETERFVKAFAERQDANSIDRYRIDEVTDWGAIERDMQTMGLFVEKRLFIFTGSLGRETSKKGETGEKTEKKSSEGESMLLKICENIDDETFLIFSGVIFDEKSPLRLWLTANADIRSYDTLWLVGSWASRFPILSEGDIKSILTKYQSALGETEEKNDISYAIGQSLEKLSLLRESRSLTKEDYEESLFLESGGKMYDLTDAIMQGNAKRSLGIFHNIIESMNTQVFIPSFMGLMRSSMYIRYMKHIGKSQDQIAKIIQSHPYVLKKNYESRIPYESLARFYNEMISINISSRSGNGRKDSELGRIFSIELAIMRLKK